jgi:hypothetical protein
MSNANIQVELRNEEKKLGNIYSKFIKLFLQLTVLFIIIAAIVLLGILAFGAGYNWALLSVDAWLIGLNVIVIIFILFTFLFYYHLVIIKKKIIEREKPKPEYLNGRRVYIYTFPSGMQGGIFSKTYIEIDKNNILRLRTLIIPPNDLL